MKKVLFSGKKIFSAREKFLIDLKGDYIYEKKIDKITTCELTPEPATKPAAKQIAEIAPTKIKTRSLN